MLIVLAALGTIIAAIAAYAFVQDGPSIARLRGQVSSIEPAADGRTDVCIRDTTDAGSSGGALEPKAMVCWDGELEGDRPEVGDCVILQTQGETDYLRVERADNC